MINPTKNQEKSYSFLVMNGLLIGRMNSEMRYVMYCQRMFEFTDSDFVSNDQDCPTYDVINININKKGLIEFAYDFFMSYPDCNRYHISIDKINKIISNYLKSN